MGIRGVRQIRTLRVATIKQEHSGLEARGWPPPGQKRGQEIGERCLDGGWSECEGCARVRSIVQGRGQHMRHREVGRMLHTDLKCLDMSVEGGCESGKVIEGSYVPQ